VLAPCRLLACVESDLNVVDMGRLYNISLLPADFAANQKRLTADPLRSSMALFTYRCPTTGLNVQGWLADDASVNQGEVFETVACPACTRMHLVNRATGRVLGGDGE